MEFTGLLVDLDGVELLSDEGYAFRVAHQDDGVGQVFGKDMEMEHGAIIVDDEFRSGDGLVLHFLFSHL